MITKIIMPKLGETMEVGILAKWRNKEGDKVEKGDIIFDVETDKAVFEVEALKKGFLRKIVVAPSEDEIEVLSVVGYIADSMKEPVPEGDSAPTPAPAVKEAAPTEPTLEKSPISKGKPDIKMTRGPKGRIFISPLARKMAQEKGIDITAVPGTGPGGRIVARDIKSGGQPVIAETAKTGKTPSRANKIVAERMTLSKTTIPHYYLSQKINMTKAVKLRNKIKGDIKKKHKVNLTITDFIIQALSKTLQEFLNLNALWENDSLHISKEINIGVATSWDDELFVPVIKNAQKLKIIDIAKERTKLVTSIRTKKIDIDTLTGGTFTLTNLGNIGPESFAAIINPPQVGILAMGSISKEPCVAGNKVVIADIMNVTISCDHRAINGMYGAKFLVHIKELLEAPDKLIK